MHLAPMLKHGLINSGVFRLSLPVKHEQRVSLDGRSIGGPGLGLLIDEEFLMNTVRIDLKEVFLSEFENFMGLFPVSGPTRQKMVKKNTGRAKVRARI